MAKIHQLNCDTNRRNTGYGGCPVDWQLIKGAFLFESPKTFTEAELADLRTTLDNLAKSDTKSLRCYPINNFVNPTDNTEQPVIQTFADGSKAVVRDGVYDWSFQFTQGGFCLLQALRTHNSNGGVYALFYDNNKKILGYNNNGSLAAIPLQFFYADPWKMNTGQAVAVYMARFVFSTNYVNEDAEYTQADFILSDVVGLQDIKLVINTFSSSLGAANVSVITECGGSNLYDAYSADLVAALWLATNKDTGGVVTVTSVTPVASSKTFNVQFNHSDPDYPTSGTIDLTLAAPSVLDVAGIVGYEAEIAQLPVPNS